MKNKKVIFLILVFIFLFALVYFVINISGKYNVENDNRDRVIGFWELEKYKVYEDGELVLSEEKYKKLLVKFSPENVQFCYEKDDNYDCFSHNYWMKAGKMILYLFEDRLETEFTYTLNRDVFVLKDGDDKNYTLSEFVKIGDYSG